MSSEAFQYGWLESIAEGSGAAFCFSWSTGKCAKQEEYGITALRLLGPKASGPRLSTTCWAGRSRWFASMASVAAWHGRKRGYGC